MADEDQLAWQVDTHELAAVDAIELGEVSPEWALGGATGEGVRVAVVDSGIEADHPALHGCVDVDACVSITLDDEGQPVVEPGLRGDAFGHGTACAGIIHELAPAARITSVAVLGPRLSGKGAAFHRGLAWAVDAGFDVINLSLGTSKRGMGARLLRAVRLGVLPQLGHRDRGEQPPPARASRPCTRR